MNLENLETKTYNSYTELCKVLEIPIKRGNSKKPHLEELKRYFNYEIINRNQFKILEIYDEPIKVNKFHSRQKEHTKYAELLLINSLLGFVEELEESELEMWKTTNELANMVNLIHQSYLYYINKRPQLAKMLNVDITRVDEFFNATQNSLRQTIESLLKRLQRNAVIIYETRWVVQVDMNELFEEMGIEYKKDEDNKIIRFSTEDERDLILTIRAKVMREEYNAKDINKIFAMGKEKEYYKKVNEALEDYGIYKAYIVHTIITDKKYLNRAYEYQYKRLTKKEIEEYEKLTPILFAEEMFKNANERWNKAKQKMEKYGFNSLNENERNRLYGFDYNDSQKRIGDKVIKGKESK